MLYLFPFTTSLNFLFFWLTWTTLVLSHSPLRVELFGTAATRLLFYLFPSTLFFVFDVLFPSASASIKAQGQIALPTGHKRRKLGGTEIWIAAWSILNIILSISAQAIVEYTLTKILRVKSAIKVSVRLPYPWALLVDLVRGFILREVCHFSLERLYGGLLTSHFPRRVGFDLCFASIYPAQSTVPSCTCPPSLVSFPACSVATHMPL